MTEISLNTKFYKKTLQILMYFAVLFMNFTHDAKAKNSIRETLPAQIKLATFDIDVTPDVGQKLAFDPVINKWDLGLRAKGVIILGSGDPIILLAIDWLGISFETYDTYKNALAITAGTVTENVAIHTLHQHDAPEGKNNNEYVLSVLNSLQSAVQSSVKEAKAVTHIGFGEAEVFQIALNRRILDVSGDTVRAMRMSRCRDSLLRAEPEGVIDPLVSLVSFWSEGEPLAVMSFYATHPQSYYRTGIPNPDFPGIARFYRQLAVPEALHIHFTGAAGNVAAGKYNDGSRENRGILAERLANGMRRAWEGTSLVPVFVDETLWKSVSVILPADTTKKNNYIKRYNTGVKIDIQCLTLDKTRILFMPGELFVEYQLAAKKMRKDLFIAMAAYGDYSPSYIPTAEAYLKGGFEVKASRVTPKTEEILLGTIGELLHTKP